MISRLITPHILRLAQGFPIISLTGPRQAGKTTLLRQAFPSYRYVNLELPDLRAYAAEDPRAFLREYDRFVIFDEAQRVPELFSYLQGRTDEDRIMGQYILSGSQNFLLLDAVSQSLAGRTAVLKLMPFSFAELGPKLPGSPEQAMWQGGYPALYDRPLTPAELFPAYLETYLERDVRSIAQVQNLGAFRNFIRLCAGRTGQPLNYQSLATEAGITAATVRKWITLLEASYLLFQLGPYYENLNKRFVKSPKLYFWDTGLLCHLLGITDPGQLGQYYGRSSIFENMAIAELLKQRLHRAAPVNSYFWRDHHHVETDLILQEGLQTLAYEFKFSFTARSEYFKGIERFRQAAPHLTGPSYAVYAGDESQTRSQGKILSWRQLGDAGA
ncbi:MAG: ATP-binding protein [Bacteroidia bacterium]|nr:ATP-binding protein [Bacteroidia bacterium]